MSASNKKFYVTTPIYYVNARPHIGHAYTTIVADVLARRHRLLGPEYAQDTFFLTGTDEHGQKIERSAAAAGIPPQQFTDKVAAEFQSLWDRMGITYDRFIRTTSPAHQQGAQKLFATLYERGHIYLDSYTGAYCVSDEAFVDAPIGTPCPDCGRLLEEVTEENFFFKLSAFQRPLLDLIESGTLKIENEARRNEVLSFLRGNLSAAATQPAATQAGQSAATEGAGGFSPLKQPTTQGALAPGLATTAAGIPYVPGALKDLSVSRSSFTWGIPVPEPAASAAKDKHVIYVWLDALANYMTAIGYGSEDPDDQATFERFWPADLHLVGKEIIRFHCVYWPAFLLALNPALQQRTAPHTSPFHSSQTETAGGFSPASTEGAAGFSPASTEGAASFSPASTEGAGGFSPLNQPATEWALAPGLSPDPATVPVEVPGFSPSSTEGAGGFSSLNQPATEWALAPGLSPDPANVPVEAAGFSPASTEGAGGFSPLNQPATEWALAPGLSPDPATVPFETHQLWAEKWLPKAITAHGWLLFDNSKMSKSKGNIVRTETILDGFGDHVYAKQFPDSTKAERDLFASDVLRYFLLREIPFGQDGSFSFEALITRYNADLANGYGNLVSRVLGLISQNFPDALPKPEKPWICEDRQVFWEENEPKEPFEDRSGTRFIVSQVTQLVEFASEMLWPTCRFQILLAETALRVSHVDAYISFHKPWLLAKATDEQSNRKLIEVLYTSAEAIRVLTGLLHPVLPEVTAKVWNMLGLADTPLTTENVQRTTLTWGGLKPGTKLGPLAPIFPRADKGLTQIMTDLENPEQPRPDASLKAAATPTPAAPDTLDPTHPAAGPRTSTLDAPNPGATVAGSAAITSDRTATPSHTEAPASGIFAPSPATENVQRTTPEISIDDFIKIELRVAQIKVAERIPKADKLLRLEVDLGPDFPPRQILSGIAEWYTPEDLIGRRIVVITNLAPRKMRGLESHGMLLAASHGENGKPILATFAEDIALGSRLK